MNAPNPWYREAELLLLVLLVLGVYFARFDQPSLRGEETRWATCAREHLRTGDWIVARQQGQVHADRPPLVNWLMAGGMVLLGTDSVLAVRLPSLLATLTTTLLVYAYGRLFLSRGGALAAAAAFATMIQVMSLGRLAESDAVLTMFVAASMLVWHYGYVRQWPKAAVWCTGYLLAALAALAKGPQGPIYFAGTVTIYLLLVRRDWRYFLHPSHLLGISLCVIVVGLWAVPYYLATSWQAVYLSWGNQAASRFTLSEPGRLLAHLAGFPFEVLACMLPWSLLLIVYLKRDFWRKLDEAHPHVRFLLTAITISFLPVWICQGARNRYCMPFYPCAALLVGLAIERCWQFDASSGWESAWRRFAGGLTVVMLGAAAVILCVSLVPQFAEIPLAQPLPFAFLYAVGALLLAGILWRACVGSSFAALRSLTLPARRAGVLSIAAFMGLTVTGVKINSEVRTSEDMAASVARLKAQLPPGVQIVSFGRTHHRFAWHYGQFIPELPWPQDPQQISPDVDYFCFERADARPRELHIPWEQVALISCERNRSAHPHDKVIIGRRRPATPTAVHASPSRR